MKYGLGVPRILLAMFCLLCAGVNAGEPRSGQPYPLGDWRFGEPAPSSKSATSASEEFAGTPRFEQGRLVTIEILGYAGKDYRELEAELLVILERMRHDFGGVTFGVDAATGTPVEFGEAVEASVLEMLRTAPALAEDVRRKGGSMTATFEFRPVRQPSNANLYVHAIYAAKLRKYQLKILLDDPNRPLRQDITGIEVDMQSQPVTP